MRDGVAVAATRAYYLPRTIHVQRSSRPVKRGSIVNAFDRDLVDIEGVECGTRAKRGGSSNCEEGAYRHFEVGSLR